MPTRKSARIFTFPGCRRPSVNADTPASRAAPVTVTARPRDRDCLKYFPPEEQQHRRIVAWVSAAMVVLFLSLAVVGVLLHRSLVLLPCGSDLIIEAAMAVWPACWPLAALHNIVVAGVATLFLIAVTTGHTGLPGNPRDSNTVVWRRQTPFAYPEIALGSLVFSAGLVLQWHGHTVLAALLESPAAVLLLHACGHLFVPIMRMFVLVEFDPNGGLTNRITIGGGRYGINSGMIVIPHGRLIDAHKSATFLEWCFGLASLSVAFVDTSGCHFKICVPALASAAVVQHIEEILKGKFRAALSDKSLDLPVGHPLRNAAPAASPNR
jgi:hypothetical protein